MLVIQKFFEFPEIGPELVGPLVVDEARLTPAGPETHLILEYDEIFMEPFLLVKQIW